jgi:F-type H+-transporting ATPase subunit b
LKASAFHKIMGMILSALMLWGLFSEAAWAGDGIQFTRAHYDLIMRYLNFLILAAVLYKFGRKPLLGFLNNQKNEVAATIDNLEARKQEALEKIKQSQEHLKANKKNLAEISDRIAAEGLQRKQQIIEQAQNESQLMLQAAQAKIEGNLRDTVERLKAELVEAATEKAAEKLPAMLGTQDHERLFQQWLEAVENQHN